MDAAVRVYDLRELLDKTEINENGIEGWKASIMSSLADTLILLHEAGVPIPVNPIEPKKD